MGMNTVRTGTLDIYLEYRWSFLLVGFAQNDGLLYTAYTFLIFAINTYMGVAAAYSTVFVDKKESIVNAIHMIIGSIFITWCLGSKLLNHRSMVHMRKMTNKGIYDYQDEEEDGEQARLKVESWSEVKSRIDTLGLMYILGFFSNMVFFPLTQYFLLEEEERAAVNPYLPHVFYSPFDTRTLLGYSMAYFLDFIFWLNIYTSSVVINAVYISYTSKLKADLRLLNHSIKNLHSRALSRYNGLANVPQVKHAEVDERRDFQKCLHLCLKANLKHHQAILRFKEEGQAFIGSVLFVMIVLASLIYATILYCLFQNPPVNVLINYALTSVAEQTFTLFICYFGEEVLTESKLLFETIYATSWYSYDGRFKRSLQLMMCRARKPIEIKAMLLNVPSCLQTYGDILTAMYKLMNLARQSDAV